MFDVIVWQLTKKNSLRQCILQLVFNLSGNASKWLRCLLRNLILTLICMKRVQGNATLSFNDQFCSKNATRPRFHVF